MLAEQKRFYVLNCVAESFPAWKQSSCLWDGSFALAEGLFLLPAICFFARGPVWKIAQVTVVYTRFLNSAFLQKPGDQSWLETEHLQIFADVCQPPRDVGKEAAFCGRKGKMRFPWWRNR